MTIHHQHFPNTTLQICNRVHILVYSCWFFIIISTHILKIHHTWICFAIKCIVITILRLSFNEMNVLAFMIVKVWLALTLIRVSCIYPIYLIRLKTASLSHLLYVHWFRPDSGISLHKIKEIWKNLMNSCKVIIEPAYHTAALGLCLISNDIVHFH